MADMKQIHEFAIKWCDKFRNQKIDYIELVDHYIADDCAVLGFEMDCGHAFAEKYGSAASDSNALDKIIDEVDDISLLGSAIYSQWRYLKFDDELMTNLAQAIGDLHNQGVTDYDRVIKSFVDAYDEDSVNELEPVIKAAYNGINKFYTDLEEAKANGTSSAERAKAKALLLDIATWNPERYEELMKMGEEKAIAEMGEIITENHRHSHEMKKTILEQMGKPESPEDAAQKEWAARMIAQEMAQEELRHLYN